MAGVPAKELGMRRTAIGISSALLAACNQQTVQNQPAANAPEPVVSSNEVAPATNAAAKPAPLSEPKGPIDPKSVEAAGQVVQSYGALIEQHRLGEAARLWGDSAAAANFARGLPHEIHLEIGDLGETEGAAGSIYTTMPVTFYGDKYRRAADVILRRVNDVDGSTEAQRRWHIERIEWKVKA
jgi:hypothetical protein